MALAYTQFFVADTTAIANNCPLIVPENFIATRTASTFGDPFWNTGGLFGSTDITDPARTGERLRDHSLVLPSGTLATGGTVYYVNHVLAGGAEADFVAVKLHSMASDAVYTVQVQFGTSDFTTSIATVAEWTGVNDTVRRVQHGLDYPEDSATDGVNRFTTPTHVRLRIEQTAGAVNAPPEVSEFVVGRAQILSHAIETGSDDVPRGVEYAEMMTAGRHRFRYVLAEGFEDHSASYHFGEVSALNYNDLATLRTIQTACRYGALPVWARWRTGSNWVFGYFDGGMDLPIRRGEYTDRGWNFQFYEQPPFAATEA